MMQRCVNRVKTSVQFSERLYFVPYFLAKTIIVVNDQIIFSKQALGSIMLDICQGLRRWYMFDQLSKTERRARVERGQTRTGRANF